MRRNVGLEVDRNRSPPGVGNPFPRGPDCGPNASGGVASVRCWKRDG